jgi:ferredoxin-like protein FixX
VQSPTHQTSAQTATIEDKKISQTFEAPRTEPILEKRKAANLDCDLNYFKESGMINSNVEDYLRNHSQNCPGCGNCLKQMHKLLSYKYPRSINSRYMELYREHKNANEYFQKNNFNYDRMRQQIKNINPETTSSLERKKDLQKMETTNKRMIHKDKKEIDSFNIGKSAKREDCTLRVPIGCFFGNTVYTNQFC